MNFSPYESALRRIVSELRPYLDEIVIIGGWVPYLYKRYGGFNSWNANTSLTAEVDVLVDRPLPPGERPSIPELLRRADFRPSEEEGSLAVWEGDVQAGEKIEFLVPHEGISRQEGTVVLVTAQAGMGAIPLGGLELMRRFKQKLAIPVAIDSGEQSVEIWVPALGAYTVNKASTFSGVDRPMRSRRAPPPGSSTAGDARLTTVTAGSDSTVKAQERSFAVLGCETL